MRDNILVKRYSIAFFRNVSQEQINQLLEDINILNKIVSEYPSFIAFLHSPIVNNNKKDNILKNVSELLNLADKWYLFFKLLIKKKRFVIFKMILKELEKIVYMAMGKVKVKIILARTEAEGIIKKIGIKIAEIVKKSVISEVSVNPKIIGGFIAQTESLRIDGSIKGNLIRLQKIIQE